jgi:hypothetical protein
MKKITIVMLILLPTALGVAYAAGWFLDCEFIHWTTLHRVARANAPAGQTFTQLVADKAGVPASQVDGHHCGWCRTVYSHCPHRPVKAIVSDDIAYLFDWNSQTRVLRPATIATAKAFPELIPTGAEVIPIGTTGLDGQLFQDPPCIVEMETAQQTPARYRR